MTTPDAGIRIEFQTHALDNGLQVILQPDRSCPVVAAHIMYHVGSRDEEPGRTGFAHLFEHLLFQGSAHVGETDHFRLVQEAGGTLNGSTWFDRTNYFETVPSNRLDLALWLEADRMGWLLPAISQVKLDNQRDVVKNERRQSYENRPYGLATETVLRHAFPVGHPYRHPTIGSMADLDAATLDDVKLFFRTWYVPGNAVLVLCGDFAVPHARGLVEHYFGDIPAGPVPRHVRPPDPGRTSECRAVLPDDVSVPRVYVMYHAPSVRSSDYETSAVLASLLGGCRSARLHDQLVYEKRVAGEVHAHLWPLESAGMLWLVATARPGVTAPELEEAMDETLARLVREGIRREEARGALHRSRRQLLRRLDGVGGRADALAHAAVLRDDPGYVNAAFGIYARIGREELNRCARGLLVPERRTVLHVVPQDRDIPGGRDERADTDPPDVEAG